MVSMNILAIDKRVRVIAALVEGNSIRAMVRMTGAAKNTITKLLADLGEACAEYQDRVFVDLPCTRIQLDEIWSFCYAKKKNLPAEKRDRHGYGDIWTWVAICADTKLVPCWLVGGKDAGYATEFLNRLAWRFNHRVQVTSDGHSAYLRACFSAQGMW